MSKKWLIIWIASLCGLTTAGAAVRNRPLNVESITTYEGLSSNCIYAITQDHTGYMWFGTDSGLDRYDGKTVRHYRTVLHDTRSPGGSRINCLLSTDAGVLIGTERGLDRYAPDVDAVVPYEPAREIGEQNIRTLFEENSLLWIGTNNGLFCLDRRTGAVECYDTDNSGLSHNIVRAVYADADYLFVGTFDGVSRLNKRTDQWSSVNLKADRFRLPLNNLVLSIESSPHNPEQLLIGTQTGLCRLDKHSLRYTVYEKSRYTQMVNNTIKTMCVVGDEVWLGSEDGLMIFDGDDFTSYEYDPKKVHSLPNNIIWSIYKDRGNVVWLATEGGIACYDAGVPAFTACDLKQVAGNPHVGMSVFAAERDRHGRLWLGSRFGLALYEPDNNRMRWINLSNSVDGTYNFIRSLSLDDNDILWIGTAEGLICYDTQRDCEIPIQPQLRNRMKYIFVVAPDSDGKIYLCNAHGYLQIIDCQFDRATRRFTTVSDRMIFMESPTESMVVTAHHVWLGTRGRRLIRYDKLTGETNNYRLPRPSDADPVGPDEIRCMFVDPNTGRLWVGTDCGLEFYDEAADTFDHISVHKTSDAVYTICNDPSGLLWLTTQHGIACYDILSHTFRLFSLKHWFGRYNTQFPVSVLCGDDVLVFGLDSYLRLNRADLNAAKDSAPLRITDIRINNSPISALGLCDRPVHELERLRLTHDQNIVAVCFAMLDYSTPLLTRYTYMLEGYDSSPKVVNGTLPYAEYTNLPPGRYRLHVEAVSCDGVSASNELDFEIVVTAPWYSSWWAKLIYGLIVIMALGYVRWVTRRRRLAEETLQKEKLEREKIESVNHLKLRFFTNVSHDFRTPLSLILSPVETLLETETDPVKSSNLQIIHQNALRLLRLVNQILDFRKVENQKMKLKPVSADIVSVLRGICSSFSELAQKKQIALSFESGEERLIMEFDPDKIDKIFVNLLSNALKFTAEDGQILVSLRRKDTGDVEIIVADTGIGISDNDLPHIFERFYQVEERTVSNVCGTGIGLTIVKELVELHGGRIEVMSRERQGTSFIVTLPIVNEVVCDDAGSEAEELPADAAETGLLADDEPADEREFALLLVEDDTDMRTYLASELNKRWRTIAVADAESGLKIVSEMMPDLVITDVMLPGIDGIDFCRRIKGDFMTNHIPVVVLSARTAEEYVIEAFDAGADEYIGKPFNLKVFETRIDNLLIQRRLLRDNLRRDTVDIASVDRQSPDELFIRKVVALIEEHMANPDMNIPFLCDKLAVSHVNFYRKVKALTGMNVNAFIREIRLKKAAQLLRVKGMSVTDAMYEVGFNHRSYFSMCFRNAFGMTPKAYAKQFNNEISSKDD